MEIDENEFDIFKLNKQELEKVPFDIAKWQCKIKLCKCYTRVRDYGIHHVYYHPRGIRTEIGIEFWININKVFFLCSKHYKVYKNVEFENIPLKKSKLGGIIWGFDDTGKQLIIY